MEANKGQQIINWATKCIETDEILTFTDEEYKSNMDKLSNKISLEYESKFD